MEAGDRIRGPSVFRTLGHFHHIRRMSPPASRNAVLRLLNASRHTACPCHGCSSTAGGAAGSLQAIMNLRKYAAPVKASKKEYAFEVFILFCARLNAG